MTAGLGSSASLLPSLPTRAVLHSKWSLPKEQRWSRKAGDTSTKRSPSAVIHVTEKWAFGMTVLQFE